MLESARRAASEGKTRQEIEQAALDTARQQQEAAQAAQAAQAAEAQPCRAQPAPPAGSEKRRRKTRAEAEAELAQRVHDDHLWLNNPVMMRGLGLAPIVVAASQLRQRADAVRGGHPAFDHHPYAGGGCLPPDRATASAR